MQGTRDLVRARFRCGESARSPLYTIRETVLDKQSNGIAPSLHIAHTWYEKHAHARRIGWVDCFFQSTEASLGIGTVGIKIHVTSTPTSVSTRAHARAHAHAAQRGAARLNRCRRLFVAERQTASTADCCCWEASVLGGRLPSSNHPSRPSLPPSQHLLLHLAVVAHKHCVVCVALESEFGASDRVPFLSFLREGGRLVGRTHLRRSS